jgi:fructose-specific phosphotransferase system component IIB
LKAVEKDFFMNGLIIEIQKACLEEAVSVESLLRRVKLAATKLKLGDLESWVDSELNGYSSELPPHRILHGQPAGWNPYHGWVPVQTNGALFAEFLGTAMVAQGISGLRDLISSNDGDIYHFPIPDGLVTKMNKLMSVSTARMVVQVPRGGIVGILDFVRNKVLDWAIEMERNGVVGEGLSFDEQEVESAKIVMTTFNIGKIDNFAGNMGTGNASGDISLTTHNVTKIKEALHKLQEFAHSLVEAGASDTLPDTIDAIIVEVDKDAPDTGKLRNLTQDVRSALAGAAGNLTAEGALVLVGGILRVLGGG